MAKNEHRWPVPVAALTDGSMGAALWQHRGQVHLTVAFKATFAIPRDGDLLVPVRSAIVPVQTPDAPNEVTPFLTRAEVHLRSHRECVHHLAVYRGQEQVLKKSGPLNAFALVPLDDPRRAAMDGILGSLMLTIPEGFPWAAMQAAPEDQQLDSFTGSEWVMLGATGDDEATRIHLPGLVVSLKAYGEDPLPVIPAPRLDMIVADLRMVRCSLIWRTHIVVEEATTLLKLTAIAGAAHKPDQAFQFPATLPAARIVAACPLPEGGERSAPIRVPAASGADVASALQMTMGAAPARGPALPFAHGVSPAVVVGTRDRKEAPASRSALTGTQGGAVAAPAALPFAGANQRATPRVVVGSSGAPWEQPAQPVPRVAVPTADQQFAADRQFAVVSPGRADAPAAEKGETLDAEEIADAYAPVATGQPAPIPGAPWSSARASEPPIPTPPPSVPAPVSVPPPRPPAVSSYVPPPPPVVASVPTIPGGAPRASQPSAHERAAVAAAVEQRRQERERARDAKLRELQMAEKRLKEELEARAADEALARAAEAKRQQDEERAELQRRREIAEREEAERQREREAQREAKRDQAAKMRDALYGFRIK